MSESKVVPIRLPVAGLLASFRDPRSLTAACERLRDSDYRRWDAHTPFPVHGLDEAMGLRRSPLGWIVFVLGTSAASAAMLLQWWISANAYPLNVSAKPLFSWPAFVPVTFELGILGAALGAVLGLFFLARLPRLHHPLFSSELFERATDDGFLISIEADDPLFELRGTRLLLESLGAVRVEEVER